MRARSERATARSAGAAKAASDDAGFTPASVLSLSALTIETHGAVLHPSAALSILPAIDAAIAHAPPDRAGVRLHRQPALAALLTTGPIAVIARAALGPDAQPVRAVLFDKSPAANWTLGWHQDRTIAVRARHDIGGFGPWSVKAGVQHVEPPFAVIAAMLTVRIHLDDVPADNAPLLVAPGSHRLGRIATDAVGTAVERCGSVACLARRGDVWTYATPILHASDRSHAAARRRVLQVDYSATALPAPLAWLGV